MALSSRRAPTDLRPLVTRGLHKTGVNAVAAASPKRTRQMATLPPHLSLLVVEPHRHLAGIMRHALTTAGVSADNIEDVRTATEALVALTSKPAPDAILLEMDLADAPGTFLLGRIKSLGLGVPALVVAASAEEWRIREALDAGAKDYVLKPFSQGLLAHRVKRVLDQRSDTVFIG